MHFLNTTSPFAASAATAGEATAKKVTTDAIQTKEDFMGDPRAKIDKTTLQFAKVDLVVKCI